MSISRIVYRFGDSSVPPPYHRSYTITVNASEISAVVDSYGDIVGETSEKLEEGQFEEIVKALKNAQLEVGKDNQDAGCTGGTTESVKYWTDGEDPDFSGYVYHCGGSDFGTLRGDVKAFGAKLKELLPDLPPLLR